MHNLRRSISSRTLQGVSLPTAKRSFAVRASRAMPIVAAGRQKKNKQAETTSEMSDRDKRMAEFTASINKEYGQGTMQKLIHKPDKVPSFSTGLLSVDLILGGGIPFGRIVEIFGPEGSGKTTLALHIMKGAQDLSPENHVQYIDTEYALNPEYAKRLGLDPQRMALTQPQSGEDCFSIIDKTMRSRLFTALCVDSVASMVPLAELEGSIEDQQMAPLSRLMSRGVKKVVNANSSVEPEQGVTVVFINQIRMKIGVYGNPETRPGGKALPFHSMTILEVRAGQKIEDTNGKLIGHKLKIKNPKNKIANPHGIVEVDLLYGRGICKAGSLLDGALQMDVIKQSGSYYSLGNERLGQGRQKVIERLRVDYELAKKIEDLAKAEYALRSEWDTAEPAQEQKTENLKDGPNADPETPDTSSENLTAA